MLILIRRMALMNEKLSWFASDKIKAVIDGQVIDNIDFIIKDNVIIYKDGGEINIFDMRDED